MSLLTQLDQFQPTELNNYVSNREYPTQLGEALFPNTKQESGELRYIKGANGLPVSASVHALDTESEIAAREPLQVVTGKIPLIKRKIGVNEESLLQLSNLRENSPAFQSVLDTIYNDVDNMVKAVQTRIERFRYEALSTGAIDINDENGVTYKLDYGFDESRQIGKIEQKWDDEDSNPLRDLADAILALQSQGYTPTRLLTSTRVLSTLFRNKSVQAALGRGTADSRPATLPEINNLFQAMGLPQIATEDRHYRVQLADGTYKTERYIPQDTVIILPDGPIGQTVFAPTPEEIALRSNQSVQLGSVGNIITEIYDENVDPVATYTKAVARALPSFERADEVLILNEVISGPEGSGSGSGSKPASSTTTSRGSSSGK